MVSHSSRVSSNFVVVVDVDREHRAEDLLLHELEVRVLGDDDGGLDEVALGVVVVAAGDDLGVAGLLGVVDVVADVVERGLVDDGAHEVAEVLRRRPS